MDRVNPEDSQQNAFVQDWLNAWADKHVTVENMAAFHGVAPDHFLIRERVSENRQKIYAVVEEIQGTYSHDDHSRRRSAEVNRGTYVLFTRWEAHEPEMELFDGDTRPRLGVLLNNMEPEVREGLLMMDLYLGNINGGDSIMVEHMRRVHDSFVVEIHDWQTS